MRVVLDMAITDANDVLRVGPIIDHSVDLRAVATACGHSRAVQDRALLPHPEHFRHA